MKKKHYSTEQIVKLLRQGEQLLAAGNNVEEVVRELGISLSSWHRWRTQYKNMDVDQAKELKAIKDENAKLKKLLAEAELDKAMLKELAEGNFQPRDVDVQQSHCSAIVSGFHNDEHAHS
jgi:putative transposase